MTILVKSFLKIHHFSFTEEITKIHDFFDVLWGVKWSDLIMRNFDAGPWHQMIISSFSIITTD